jgi:hypothetical protein
MKKGKHFLAGPAHRLGVRRPIGADQVGGEDLPGSLQPWPTRPLKDFFCGLRPIKTRSFFFSIFLFFTLIFNFYISIFVLLLGFIKHYDKFQIFKMFWFKFVQILNFFKIWICSIRKLFRFEILKKNHIWKFVQVWKMLQFWNCSHLKNIWIWKSLNLKNCSDLKFAQNLKKKSELEKRSNLKIVIFKKCSNLGI